MEGGKGVCCKNGVVKQVVHQILMYEIDNCTALEHAAQDSNQFVVVLGELIHTAAFGMQRWYCSPCQ